MGPEGTWRSALGAVMTLHAGSDGALVGTYRSATGHVEGDYPLLGRFDPAAACDGGAVGAALGWTVVWGDAHSATTWCGRWSGDGSLRATWLLTGGSGADWEATRVGHDVFVRVDPGESRTMREACWEAVSVGPP